jgi:S-adenosylmethionine:diacylglycerol 3-amino-3-carboxypropyl transferase
VEVVVVVVVVLLLHLKAGQRQKTLLLLEVYPWGASLVDLRTKISSTEAAAAVIVVVAAVAVIINNIQHPNLLQQLQLLHQFSMELETRTLLLEKLFSMFWRNLAICHVFTNHTDFDRDNKSLLL